MPAETIHCHQQRRSLSLTFEVHDAWHIGRGARRKSAVSARLYQQGSPAGLGFRRADVEGLCLHVDTSQR